MGGTVLQLYQLYTHASVAQQRVLKNVHIKCGENYSRKTENRRFWCGTNWSNF